MKKFGQDLSVAIVISLLPTLTIWIPFVLGLENVWHVPIARNGLATLAANYDGPLYIVVARTLYNLDQIKTLFSFPLPVEYYAAHFPLYPALIRIGAIVTNYAYSMLAVTLFSSIFCIYYFFKFISQYTKSRNEAILLTFVFSIFPARWLIVRSVGSPEPLFIGSILASIYHFQLKQYGKSGIFGALAQLTKSPGILLFVAYAGYISFSKFKKLENTKMAKWLAELEIKAYPVVLIPLALLGVFTLYYYTFGNFFAYFNSGDNIHLLFPPFQIFNYSAAWVNTHWLEEILLIYLLICWGFLQLIKQKQGVIAWFVGVFFFSILFVSHRDIMRYSLPVLPFLYVAYKDVILKPEFKFVLGLLLIPIYLFSLAYISNNVMPIADWSPFL